ncbi:hypothetical protein [Singulisphaera sp. PoT]|uniref:hypothetical protein n=1 Tax=Singulisphaera sp. PoT TaxID=3411797 RepID=UPI003BF59E06
MRRFLRIADAIVFGTLEGVIASVTIVLIHAEASGCYRVLATSIEGTAILWIATLFVLYAVFRWPFVFLDGLAEDYD